MVGQFFRSAALTDGLCVCENAHCYSFDEKKSNEMGHSITNDKRTNKKKSECAHLYVYPWIIQ